MANNNDKIFINCPFNEKDEAKKEGAKWDGFEKKWYIPAKLFHQIERFNKWKPKGRVYLNCPYSEKNQAKDRGAKWDGIVRKWYYYPKDVINEEDFAEWLPKTTRTPEKKTQKKEEKKNTSDGSDPSTGTSTPSKTAKLAALPRVNKDMTVSQLQDECRSRDPSIKGISNKNKQWLSDHLGIGSIWTTMADSETSSIKSSNNKNFMDENKDTTPQRQVRKQNKTATNSTKQEEKESRKKPKNTNEKSTVTDIKSLPRINETLTIAQLSHELHHRNPTITGTSNKNKKWFLDRLGVGSIWMTSSEAQSLNLKDHH